MSDAPDSTDSIWVISDLLPTGDYITVVHSGEDAVLALATERAMLYAATVMEAAARAEYDQAVYAQMCDMGVKPYDSLKTVMDLREDRPPLDDSTTAPFRFEPIVASKTALGEVNVYLNGEHLSQWSLADARQHALHVFDACGAVHLDAAYYRYLVGVIGIAADKARQMVHVLRSHRPNDEGGYQDQRRPVPSGPRPGFKDAQRKAAEQARRRAGRRR